MTSAALRRIHLTNVRVHGELEVALGPGLTILRGPNGAGKTSVLEAVAVVLRGTSLRSGAIRDLIRWNADFLRIEAELEVDGMTTTAAAAYGRDGERKLTADGSPLEDPSRWRELLAVRSFVPDDLRLIKGSPRRRREYLDSLASRSDPAYSSVLRQYDEALGQRNSLLRSRWSAQDATQFTPWEQILARTGLEICRGRAAALAQFIEPFQSTHALLSGEAAESIKLTYRTNVAGMDVEDYESRLAENRGADQQRTFTHLGPHRDDLRLVRSGLDMRERASQGEQRTAVLALVLAEWAGASDQPRSALLLLDDVMSELDESRRRSLVGILTTGGQVVVTTTDLRYFSDDELRQATVIELPKA
jgi:DNA replication and repair protein RecF